MRAQKAAHAKNPVAYTRSSGAFINKNCKMLKPSDTVKGRHKHES
jgi:hypothetical protein